VRESLQSDNVPVANRFPDRLGKSGDLGQEIIVPRPGCGPDCRSLAPEQHRQKQDAPGGATGDPTEGRLDCGRGIGVPSERRRHHNRSEDARGGRRVHACPSAARLMRAWHGRTRTFAKAAPTARSIQRTR
jgi:hypothetical protein